MILDLEKESNSILLFNCIHPTAVLVQLRLPGAQPELTVSEGIGNISEVLFIERLGRIGQGLIITLQVDTESGTDQGMNLLTC